MKHIKKLILLVFILSAIIITKTIFVPLELEYKQKISSSSGTMAYTSHDPFYIDENGDFGPSGYNFTGDGSKSSPWKIMDFDITNATNTLIYIQDTTDYFIISDNLLDGINGSNDGIVLSNVVNGTISNNTIKNSKFGISVSDSEHIVISGNSVFNNHEDGVALYNSNNSLLFENIIHNNGVNPGGNGVYLDPSNHNIIFNNTIFNNSKNGIVLNNSEYNTISNNNVFNNHQDGVALYNSTNSLLFENIIHTNGVNPGGNGVYLDPSNYNLVLNNTIFDNDESGIFVNESEYNTFVDNNVFYNHEDGVYLHDSSFNVISNNLIHHNGLNPGGNGVYLDPSNYNTINNNDIYNNTLSGVNISSNSENNQIKQNNFLFNGPHPEDKDFSQAYDKGSFNLFDFNYWNDHNNTSTIVEGIADNAYSINGTAGNKDEHPKATPFTPTLPTTYCIIITTTTTFSTTIPSVTTTTTTETTTEPGTAPGWTIIVLLFSIITILFLRRLKRIPKR